MRTFTIVLVLTVGVAAAVWLHGLRLTVTLPRDASSNATGNTLEQIARARARNSDGSIDSLPSWAPDFVGDRRRYWWDDEAAVGALGLGIGAAALIASRRTEAALAP